MDKKHLRDLLARAKKTGYVELTTRDMALWEYDEVKASVPEPVAIPSMTIDTLAFMARQRHIDNIR